MSPSPQPNAESNGTPPDFHVPPQIEAALKAFEHALPALLRERSGDWVAYHGGRQVGFGKTKTELYQHCLVLGLKRGEFLVRRIQPQVEAVGLDPRMID